MYKNYHLFRMAIVRKKTTRFSFICLRFKVGQKKKKKKDSG